MVNEDMMPPQIDRQALSRILSERTDELELDSYSATDWERLIRQAQAEGVAPLVYWALSRAGKLSSLPKPAAHSLRAMYVSLRMNNEQLLKELELLTSQFAQAEIPAVALKGICFALTVYPDIGLRPMVDLDLLVPASQAPEALRIATAAGYDEAFPEALPGLNGLLNHAVCLRKNARPFTILEVHQSLVAEGSFTHAVPVAWFWSQTEPIDGISSERGLNNLRILTPTAQLLYACAHAMLQHGGRYTSLRWLYDLDRLICVYAARLDWDLLLAQAERFAWGSAVSAALSQGVTLFDTPVPQNVLDELSKQSDRNAERVATMQEHPATHTLEEYQKLKSLDWRGRFKLFLALVVPGPAYMRWRYELKTSWALPAFYLYRWWGILKDAIKTFVIFVRKVVFHAGHRKQSQFRVF